MDTMGKIYLTDTLASLRDLYFNNIHRLFPQFSIFEFLAYHLAKSRSLLSSMEDGKGCSLSPFTATLDRGRVAWT